MQAAITVRVPATTANLGPGFDTLALALDLWNEASFTLQEGGLSIQVQGEGAHRLAQDRDNRVALAVEACYAQLGRTLPGLSIRCTNHIPIGSGLGSSASAVLMGLLGANALCGEALSRAEILELAIRLEGHPDNAAAALYGGLAIIAQQEPGDWLVRRFNIPRWQAAVVLPGLDFPTGKARAALPKEVSRQDAVFNVGRTALVVEALRTGDLALLAQVMEDRLHQPYRLPLIPGAAHAVQAARQAGAVAAISGAGPSIIAFTRDDPTLAGRAMAAEFRKAGIETRFFAVQSSNCGAEVRRMSGA